MVNALTEACQFLFFQQEYILFETVKFPVQPHHHQKQNFDLHPTQR